jgi:hypothetical protein
MSPKKKKYLRREQESRRRLSGIVQLDSEFMTLTREPLRFDIQRWGAGDFMAPDRLCRGRDVRFCMVLA